MIEDLFSRDDFIKYVIKEDPDSTPKKKNSQIKKDYDSVLKAKEFFENINTIGNDLSKTTINNFKSLLENLNKKLFT